MDNERTSFQRDLHQIARDLVIIYNDRIKRWQICQIGNGSIILSHGRRHKSVDLLFTVEEPNGDYRAPGREDLMRCVQIVQQSRSIWDMDNAAIDRLADGLDESDTAKATHFSAESEAKFRDVAIAIFNQRTGRKTFS